MNAGAIVQSNRAAFNRPIRDFSERIDENIERRKALVLGETFGESEINLLRDDGEFECAENVIKNDVGNSFCRIFLHTFPPIRGAKCFPLKRAD